MSHFFTVCSWVKLIDITDNSSNNCFFALFLVNLSRAEFLHQCCYQCRRVFFLFIFLTQRVCQWHYLEVDPYKKNSFLFGLSMQLPSKHILNMVQSISQEDCTSTHSFNEISAAKLTFHKVSYSSEVYSFRVFHISINWWFYTGVWVTASLIKSPGLVSGFWPFLAMLSFWIVSTSPPNFQVLQAF